MGRIGYLISALLLFAQALEAEVRGQVLGPSGEPLPGVQVRASAPQAPPVWTDEDGRFTFPDLTPPLELTASLDGFRPSELALPAGHSGEIRLDLVPLPQLSETIVITAGEPGHTLAPASVAATYLRPSEMAAAPATLTELAVSTPSVSENGQGGQFQVFSIRGVSRLRVQTLLAGVPLTSERRAGVSSSFIDAALLGPLDVLRGPASSYYGSGALGGVLQVLPRRFDGLSFETGFDSQGDEQRHLLAWGDSQRGWSLGMAYRRSQDEETPAGNPRNAAFRQWSGTFSKQWKVGERRIELLAIPAQADDIGKPNTRFPERPTVYPRERHLLLRLRVEGVAGGNLQAFLHPQDLETRTTEGDQVSEVFNDSFDLGFGWERSKKLRGGMSTRFGADYFARRGVSARETQSDSSGPIEELRTLDGATRDDLGAFASLAKDWSWVQVEGGVRFTWHQLENRGFEGRTETAWNGFVGAVAPLGGGVEAVVNVGTGLRFPSLSERFFSGTTGRGGVIGNPRLSSERSVSYDLGLRWRSDRWFVAVYGFENRIDDYIERIEIAPDLLTFENLGSGTLQGLELEIHGQLTDRLRISGGGHLLEGRDRDDQPLADVPPDRIQASLEWGAGRWQLRGSWQHRFAKNDPGSSEVAIAAADILAAGISWQATPALRFTLSSTNLLDEEYLPSADRRAIPAAGRSVGLSLAFSGG